MCNSSNVEPWPLARGLEDTHMHFAIPPIWCISAQMKIVTPHKWCCSLSNARATNHNWEGHTWWRHSTLNSAISAMENIAMWQIFQCWKSIFANSSILSSWKQLFCCCCCWRATLVSLRSDWHCHCESSQQMCYPSVSWISKLFKLDNFKINSNLIKDHKILAISLIFFI